MEKRCTTAIYFTDFQKNIIDKWSTKLSKKYTVLSTYKVKSHLAREKIP